jgi:hypothetical protein
MGRGGAMPEQERLDAIRRILGHEAEAYKRAAEWDQQRKDDLVRWKNRTLGTIYRSVLRVSEDLPPVVHRFYFHPSQCGQRASLSLVSKPAAVSVYLRSFSLIWRMAKLPRALQWPPHICLLPFQWGTLPPVGRDSG